jgi:hypothetical protein
MTEPTTSEQRVYLATVNVYGAGIAGLSAAHELMSRGFKVRIIEPDRGLGRDGSEVPVLGGLARNQFLEAPKLLSPHWWEFNEAGHWTASAPDIDTQLLVPFEERSVNVSADARTTLQRAAQAIRTKYGPVEIEVTSNAPDAATDAEYQELAEQRGTAVRRVLGDELPELSDEYYRLQVAGKRGGDRSVAAEGAAPPAPVVQIRVVKIILPGEHGFHFFPRNYRHLFDLMRRIPILAADGKESGRTAFDNLTSPPHQGFASQFPQSPGIDQTIDHLQFSMRIRRYIATCPARRAAEFEDISWLQFLLGWSPVTRTQLYVYSPAFVEGLKFSGRVLAAFDAEWGDARTNGNTFLQLELDSWLGKDKFDGTLIGDAMTYWFEPWRAYLTAAGVEFVAGRLDSFELRDGQLRALVVPAGQDLPVPDADADYFICATDVVSAEKVTANLPRVGVPASLRGYTTMVPPCPPSQAVPAPYPSTESIVRDPTKQPGTRDWDRLQTLSGVQYYFANTFDLIQGYMYFTDAPWALSSINPHQLWTHRPTLQTDGYISILSVDIGDWNASSRTPKLLGKTAWQCTRDEIAEEVWQQITTSLLRQQPDLVLPQPVWYHLDDNIVFSDRPPFLPTENRMPYQIPTVSDWKNRPVGDPWDPTPTLVNLNKPLPKELLPADSLWQAKHGGYLIHWGKLVFAGTYMRTFTRMTTMESANESARHAVNAIIDHVSDERFADKIEKRMMRSGQALSVAQEDLNTNFTRHFARPSPVGDYCKIWNPEEHELAIMKAARDEDAIRFAMSLPHAWDAAGIELSLSSASYQRAIAQGWWPPKPSAEAVADYATGVASTLPSTADLCEALGKIRERLSANLTDLASSRSLSK